MLTVIWCPWTRIIRYNGAAGSFEVTCWWHTTLWTAACHHDHSVTSGATSFCTKQPCNNFQWSITQSFLPPICIPLEAVLLRLYEHASFSHMKLVLGWALIWVNFVQEVGPKVGCGLSLVSRPHPMIGKGAWCHLQKFSMCCVSSLRLE